MNFDRTTLQAAHSQAFFNRKEILQSSLCGCFYCLKNFAPSAIEDWIDEGDPRGMTALCPYCDIDAVIGDKSGFPITDQSFLNALYAYYFS